MVLTGWNRWLLNILSPYQNTNVSTVLSISTGTSIIFFLFFLIGLIVLEVLSLLLCRCHLVFCFSLCSIKHVTAAKLSMGPTWMLYNVELKKKKGRVWSCPTRHESGLACRSRTHLEPEFYIIKDLSPDSDSQTPKKKRAWTRSKWRLLTYMLL